MGLGRKTAVTALVPLGTDDDLREQISDFCLLFTFLPVEQFQKDG